MTIFSSVGLFFMSMNPKALHSLKAAMSMINMFRNNQMPTATSGAENNPQNQELMNQLLGMANKNKQMQDLMKDEPPHAVTNVAQPTELAEEDKPIVTQVVIPAGQEYKKAVVSQEEFVQINGRYYPARADNTYMINGEKIFHLNGRRYSKEEVTGVAKAEVPSNTVTHKNENTFTPAPEPMAAPSPAPASVTQDPELPSSMNSQKVLQDLQNTQKQVEAQRKFLEQLMKEK